MDKKNKIALIIIFNHKYNKNIDVLESIYKNRFQNIFFIVPFYEGDKENVIPVYEGSHYFQGYIAQAFKFFFREEFTHYYFIADDLILNPLIDESNVHKIFNLDYDSSYISRLGSVPETKEYWPHNRNAVNYKLTKGAVEALNELPSKEDALSILKSFGIENTSFDFTQVYGTIVFPTNSAQAKNLIKSLAHFIYDKFISRSSLKELQYPLVRSYSDTFVVSAKSIKKFCHYCGIFAATDLFVELAIPTALVLSSKKINVQKDIKYKEIALWTVEDYKVLDPFNYNLDTLLAKFPQDVLFYHPIKLSKWKSKIITKKRTIVITSIFSPTEAVLAFSKKQLYNLVVVGDNKTPKEWNCDGVSYLSVEEQQYIGNFLKDVLPYNHYCRKMMGYISAIKNGADIIIDTDDDNIPLDGWEFPSFQDEFDFIKNRSGFVNIYELFTDHKIWPRGLPLNLINTKFNLLESVIKQKGKVGIWQGLADEDPDVDAIYRLTSDVPCYFNEREPVVLDKGIITPFNSQNTAFQKELFPLLYLPTFVTFRFTDILRGLVAQPIMWLYDYHLGVTKATVIQKRNPHNYFKDFISEIPMYQYSEDVIDIVTGSVRSGSGIEENLFMAYEALLQKGIVEAKELKVLDAWLKDIS